MKRVIKNLRTLKGGTAGERIAELKLQLGLSSAAYTPTTDYVKHSLATAASDFIIASGSGVFVKRTVEQTRVVLNKLYEAQEDISSGESETTLSLDSYLSLISTDSGGDTFILPDGTVTGQLKKILMKADGGDSVGDGEGLVTGTFGSDVGSLTFNNAGEFALLQWDGSQWNALELGSMFDTTNAPAFSS
jgi:hypothetical protein